MPNHPSQSLRQFTARLGIGAAVLFFAAFFLFASLTPGFNLLHDYISKLGAQGQPLGRWWNVTGFVAVGVVFAAFGWMLGRVLNDQLVGICLVSAGLGFALGAIPADFINPDTPLSRAHFASICLSLAGWCFALARIGQKALGDKSTRLAANTAGLLAVVPMIATAAGLFAAPIAHRLVLVVVFAWVVFTAVALLKRKP